MCPELYGDTGRDPHNLPNTISDSKTHLIWDFGQFYSIFLLKNRVKNRVILGNQEYLEIRSNDFCYIVLRVASHIDWRVTTDRLHTKKFIWEFWGLQNAHNSHYLPNLMKNIVNLSNPRVLQAPELPDTIFGGANDQLLRVNQYVNLLVNQYNKNR